VEGDERQPNQEGELGGRASVSPAAPRASVSPPSRGPAHNGRVLFAIAWISLQLILIVTAGRRADGAFGFRMFPESATIKLELYRDVDGARVHVESGVWGAKALDGRVRRFSWYDRVPRPYWVFDRESNAAYGSATQLQRLQSALDDVAAHVPEDVETTRFLLDVTVRRNGREPVVHRLTSRERIATTHQEVH